MIKYNFNINSHPYQVEVDRLEGDMAKVTVNGQLYEVKIEGGAPAQVKRSVKPAESIGIQTSKAVQANEETQPVSVGMTHSGSMAALSGAAVPQGRTGIPAPLPGTITEVLVSPGQSVRKGERLLVLESMKIGNDITSPRDGTVTDIPANKGDAVQEDQILVIIE